MQRPLAIRWQRRGPGGRPALARRAPAQPHRYASGHSTARAGEQPDGSRSTGRRARVHQARRVAPPAHQWCARQPVRAEDRSAAPPVGRRLVLRTGLADGPLVRWTRRPAASRDVRPREWRKVRPRQVLARCPALQRLGQPAEPQVIHLPLPAARELPRPRFPYPPTSDLQVQPARAELARRRQQGQRVLWPERGRPCWIQSAPLPGRPRLRAHRVRQALPLPRAAQLYPHRRSSRAWLPLDHPARVHHRRALRRQPRRQRRQLGEPYPIRPARRLAHQEALCHPTCVVLQPGRLAQVRHQRAGVVRQLLAAGFPERQRAVGLMASMGRARWWVRGAPPGQLGHGRAHLTLAARYSPARPSGDPRWARSGGGPVMRDLVQASYGAFRVATGPTAASRRARPAAHRLPPAVGRCRPLARHATE